MNLDLRSGPVFAERRFDEQFAWLRANDPVHLHADADGPFWVVTRHDDAVDVYRRSDQFSSRFGMRLGSEHGAVAAVADRMLIVSDTPAHPRLKRALARPFAPEAMAALEAMVRSVVQEVVSDALVAGEIDFVDVARTIPTHVVCSLMGLPRSDWEWIGAVTTEAFESDDPLTQRAAHGEIFLYFDDLVADRRRHPTDDFVSRIAADDAGGEPLSDEEIVFNCNGVLAGGNETTRYAAAGGVLAMVEEPRAWRVLTDEPGAHTETAVEEVLRWTTPGVHALRTVLAPTTIGGVAVAAGDRVTVWNVSANRDEDVFDDPFRFDVARSPNRHLSFGHSRHLCLGARLARLELTALFDDLSRRVRDIELTGAPTFGASNFTWGVVSLPVRLVPAGRRVAVAAAPAARSQR